MSLSPASSTAVLSAGFLAYQSQGRGSSENVQLGDIYVELAGSVLMWSYGRVSGPWYAKSQKNDVDLVGAPVLVPHGDSTAPAGDRLTSALQVFIEGALDASVSTALGEGTRTGLVLNRLYQLIESDQGQRALEDVFEFLESSFTDGDLNSVNDILARLDVAKLPVPMVVGVLRATFRTRFFLSAWAVLLSRVDNLIKLTGGNRNRILRGLLS